MQASKTLARRTKMFGHGRTEHRGIKELLNVSTSPSGGRAKEQV